MFVTTVPFITAFQESALMRYFPFAFVLALFACLLLTATVRAGEDKKEPANEEAKAAALVRQLGSDSFEAREAAYRELEKLGKAAVKALEEGAKSKDPEISERSKRLLALANRTEIEIALEAFLADSKDTKLLLKLPAWERFKKTFGEDEKARSLFVQMYVAEGKLLAALERDPKGFDTAINTRCQEIQKTLEKQSGNENPAMGQVVALLFTATDSRIAAKPQRVESRHYTLTALLYRANIQQEFRSNAGARQLLAVYFEQRADHPNYMLDAVNIGLLLDMKEMAPIVLKGATSKNDQSGVRASAIIALGSLGSKDNIKDIEPFLNDTTRLQYTSYDQKGSHVGYTDMRDIALAALIMMSGQDILEYDFPAVKTPGFQKEHLKNLSYISWGFHTDEQRQAALKKFKDWQEKQKK
jgi:hypothetical protein